MSSLSSNKYVKLVFFGNYFYGLCAVALSIEGALQQKYPLNNLLYYLLAFSATIVYYTNAYVLTEVSDDIANIRSMWYARNRRFMQANQLFFFTVTLVCSIYFVITHYQNFLLLRPAEWFLIFIFPLVSVFYYGIDTKYFGKLKLRNIGWLKPFIIGFTWAGLANIYPTLYYCIDTGIHYQLTLVGTFLFIKNFMFITILCIMFDIKDYAMDYNADIKTLVVKLGLRRTIFYVIIPLCCIGLGAFLVYAVFHHFSTLKILINTIPFILIITGAYSMYSRRSIFYYLIIIDGLMLVKALCGITAMTFF